MIRQTTSFPVEWNLRCAYHVDFRTGCRIFLLTICSCKWDVPSTVFSISPSVSEEQEHKPLQFPGDPFRSAIQRKTSQSPSDLFTLCSHAFRLVIVIELTFESCTMVPLYHSNLSWLQCARVSRQNSLALWCLALPVLLRQNCMRATSV